MKRIKCDCCGKYLFTTSETNMGVIAGKAYTMGYIAKLPVFYGVCKFKIFCCKACKDKWFAENISKDKLESGNNISKEFNENKEAIFLDISTTIGKLCDAIRKIGNEF